MNKTLIELKEKHKILQQKLTSLLELRKEYETDNIILCYFQRNSVKKKLHQIDKKMNEIRTLQKELYNKYKELTQI